MKFTIMSAMFAAGLAMLSASPVMAQTEVGNGEQTKPTVREVRLTEFTPFGVSQTSDLSMLGCRVFEDDLLECSSFPEKNSLFSSYTVQTRTGPRDGICHVTAYTQVFRGDRNAFQVSKAYDTIAHLLERKYGKPTTKVEDFGAPGLGFDGADHFAGALDAGVKNFQQEWSDIPGVLPTGTSISLKMVAVSDEKTFAELNYYFGGPGCDSVEDQALRGL